MRARRQAAEATVGDNDVRGTRKTRRRARNTCLACELLTASAAREPVYEPPCTAGVVNILALTVTFHDGAELDLPLETLGYDLKNKRGRLWLWQALDRNAGQLLDWAAERHHCRQRHGFGRFRRTSSMVSKATEMGDRTLALFTRFWGNGN